jgi:LPXTG-site transpeptidase (sortase) family protein
VAAALVALSLVAGCGGGDGDRDGSGGNGGTREPTAAPTTAPATTRTPDPAADPGAAIRPLPPAVAVPTTVPVGPAPQGLAIAGIGVEGAAVVPVGVEPNGEMEVPPADQVGWYRHGPRPGDGGSSVLAAHIAYGGVDGVFRHLADVEPGAEVTVTFADGTARRFRVDTVRQVAKSDLPPDVFSPTAPDRLVLITCGGAFDPTRRRYEDNILAYATPLPD